MRVTFVMEGFGPYRVPFWNELARRTELTVLLFSSVEKGRSWNVDFDRVNCKVKVLDSHKWFSARLHWAFYWTYGNVITALQENKPDVIIVGGWSSPGYWAARKWAIKNSVPMIFWSESHLLSTRTSRIWLINKAKSWFLKPFSGFYAFSPLSTQYLESFGVPKEKIVETYNLPDIFAFQKCERIGEFREPVLIYVGHLIERKGLLRLFEELFLVKHLPWRLEIVGDGPLLEPLARKAAEYGYGNRIQFHGFTQPENLNDVLRAADILCMPTFNEVWGLVVHEALLSGVFVIGSDRAAASHALIAEGINGFMCSPHESGVLAEKLRKAISMAPFDRALIRNSVEHISIEEEVDKLNELIVRVSHSTIESPRP